MERCVTPISQATPQFLVTLWSGELQNYFCSVRKKSWDDYFFMYAIDCKSPLEPMYLNLNLFYERLMKAGI
jgi:hypothetical protein